MNKTENISLALTSDVTGSSQSWNSLKVDTG